MSTTTAYMREYRAAGRDMTSKARARASAAAVTWVINNQARTLVFDA